jgi:hypothetical protein
MLRRLRIPRIGPDRTFAVGKLGHLGWPGSSPGGWIFLGLHHPAATIRGSGTLSPFFNATSIIRFRAN